MTTGLRFCHELEAEGRFTEAEKCYRSWLRRSPNSIESRLALARMLSRLGKIPEAIASYRALLIRAPELIDGWRELCWLSGKANDYVSALEIIDRLTVRGEDMVTEVAEVALALMHVCNWPEVPKLIKQLEVRFATGAPALVDPYVFLSAVDNPESHFKMARCLAAAISNNSANFKRPSGRQRVRISGGRLRVGYLCGDFGQHPTSLLMAGVLESHCREDFEIIAFDYTQETTTPIRNRVRQAFERIIDIGDCGPVESAVQIFFENIDILVDLKGYTHGTRSEILVLRPSPVQVSFLGYVGTQGGCWTDYVIADRYVIPESEQHNWCEKIVYLPQSYYPNDRTRPVPQLPTANGRLLHGLPAECFVFACFNSAHKITKEIFFIWTEILRDTPGSVLWLYESNEHVAHNLRVEAERVGVHPSRLVFARPLNLEAHIGRHVYADVFLDTCPYGAHTTAADALWAGLPLITLAGRSFASRVGVSMLHAVGLPELICNSILEYHSLALMLFHDPKKLTQIREHLTSIPMTSPLFDAKQFAANLERAYTLMAARNREGLDPATIYLR